MRLRFVHLRKFWCLPTCTIEEDGDESDAGHRREEHRRSRRGGHRAHERELGSGGAVGEERSFVVGVQVSGKEHGGEGLKLLEYPSTIVLRFLLLMK